MGAEGYVSKEVCEVTMEGMQRQIDTGEKRLNSHSTEIKQLTIISEKLTTLIEIQGKQLETQGKQMEVQGKQMAALAIEVAELKSKAQGKWYESEIGKFLVKAGVVLLFLVMAAALGKSFIEAIGPVKDVIVK